eukprot:g4199.t1
MASAPRGADGAAAGEEMPPLVEFLEVAVHQVLYARAVYPPELFERRAIYGVPVWMSRHPDLNRYVGDAVRAAHMLLRVGQLKDFVVLMLGGDGRPTERFVFETVAPEEADAMGWRLFDAFRDCLLKILTANAVLERNPSGGSFRVLVTTPGGGAGAGGAMEVLDDTMVRADPPHCTMGDVPAISALKTVHDLERTPFQLSINVEEDIAAKRAGL